MEISVVSVKRADSSLKVVKQQNWVQSLASAMRTFFDCKSYSAWLSSSIEWTFYGIADNTITAAMAFEMAYHLIVEWARPYKGAGTKNSCCISAAGELERMARIEKKGEEEKAKVGRGSGGLGVNKSIFEARRGLEAGEIERIGFHAKCL